ncbi:MAG: aminotransferase class I/II-fold pyridoxal phosphate-dependent enzyme [Myxococcales bacterium]|nr:aminotransferase class I/II-fold pyridoxal phosphate-dependent enzyme [Myxococcales bacterium]
MSRDVRLEGLLARVSPSLAGLTPYTVPPVPPRIKLDANESPWSLTGEARALIAERLAALDLHRYPDGRAEAVRQALAERLGARPDELVMGVGSDEPIAILLSTFSAPEGGRPPAVLFPGPSFVMYRLGALVRGLRPVEVPLRDDFTLDADVLDAALAHERPALAFWATPNNPTGNSFDAATLRALVEAHPTTLHVVDEAYGPFQRERPEDAPLTLAGWMDELPQVATLGTLSKIGFAGARFGWARLRPELAYEMEKVRQPFNLDAMAQALAHLVLTDLKDLLEAQLRSIVRERETLEAGLDTLGIERFPSRANFVLLRTPLDAAELHRRLLDREVAVRVFKDPRLARCARVTVGTPDENAAALTALEAALRA